MVSVLAVKASHVSANMEVKRMRLTVLNKNVDYNSYECEDCMDTGRIWDEEVGRNRPCPCRRAT